MIISQVPILPFPPLRALRALPMHRVGLVPTVGNGVEEVVHAGVLRALLSRAEVVVHHLVYYIVRDASPAV